MTERSNVILRTYGGRCVYGVRLRSGKCPALEFLEEVPTNAAAEFRKLMDRLLTQGTIRNSQRFRMLKVEGSPRVYEFKTHQSPGFRLYCVKQGTDWFATHGDEKPKDNRVKDHVIRARTIYEERAIL